MVLRLEAPSCTTQKRMYYIPRISICPYAFRVICLLSDKFHCINLNKSVTPKTRTKLLHYLFCAVVLNQKYLSKITAPHILDGQKVSCRNHVWQFFRKCRPDCLNPFSTLCVVAKDCKYRKALGKGNYEPCLYIVSSIFSYHGKNIFSAFVLGKRLDLQRH